MRNLNWLGAGLMVFLLAISAVALSAETVSSSEEYGITLTTSDRWTHKITKTNGKYFRVVIEDQLGLANIVTVAVPRSRWNNQPSIGSWMENVVIPNNLKRYTEGRTYSVVSKQVRQVTLGSGLQATALEYTISIDRTAVGYAQRSVVFIFWERKMGEDEVWYWLRIGSWGRFWDLPNSREFKEILAGIK